MFLGFSLVSFFVLFGIGAVLGLIYGVFIKGFPIWIDIFKTIGLIFKDLITTIKESSKEADIEAERMHQAWLKKKGWDKSPNQP